MPLQVIRGVTVDFPHEPYECQVTYMERVLECLDNRTNALLESPTGTGKTLALLCSTLAWQQERRRKSAYSTTSESNFWAPGPADRAAPQQQQTTIIYATRTHSQLAQVVRELKATSYSPRVAILGSREQFCIHPEVKQFTGSLQNRKCGTLTASHSCQYKNNLSSFHSQNVGMNSGVMDIEDLMTVGKREMVCPYYMMRAATDTADIILMPYNYLMDAESRKPYEMRWKDSIIIFDEAHNLESVAADSLSVEITSTLIAGCIAEVDRTAKGMEQKQQLGEDTSKPSGEGGAAQAMRRPLATLEDLLLVKKLLLSLEDELFGVHVTLTPAQNGDSGEAKATGGHAVHPTKVFEMFQRAGLDESTYDVVVRRLQKSIDRLMDEAGLLERNFTPSLESLQKSIKVIFRHGDIEAVKESVPYYSGYVKQEPPKPRSSFSSSSSTSSPVSTSKPLRTLCYWCFLPGLAMEQLAKLEVRSILLTSGTLNPLDSFASELRIPFPIRLENEHVIGAEQVLVGVLGTGVGGHQLSSSFQRRGEREYQDELGNTLVQLCSIIPDGVLVFFASYGVMDGCLKIWRRSGLWSRLQGYKTALVEPRESAQLKPCIAAFDAAIASGKGALLLAVCRGKVSEGVDFSDARARAVIITGIPFPPAKDPKVELKRKHLDKLSTTTRGGDKVLTGVEWYGQHASRAVNQAVGRVIRHRRDYGAILLLDERFGQEQQRHGMSVWLRPHIKTWSGYKEASTTLREFFRNAGGHGCALAYANKARVGAGARAPKSSREGGSSLREAVVVGEDLDRDADYVDPRAIKAVVRRDDGVSKESIEKFKEFQAAIRRTQQQSQTDGGQWTNQEDVILEGSQHQQTRKPPSLSSALMRSASLGSRSSSNTTTVGGDSSGKLPSGVAAFGDMPHSQTLSERLGFSSQTLAQKVLGQGGGKGLKRPRPLGLQGSISGKGGNGVPGRMTGIGGSSVSAPLHRSASLPVPQLTSLKENHHATCATEAAAKDDTPGGEVTADELGALVKGARGRLKAERYDMFKAKVKALLVSDHNWTLKEFQAWALSAVELFLEAGATADLLTRLAGTYLPPELQQAFRTMVTVRCSSTSGRPHGPPASLEGKNAGNKATAVTGSSGNRETAACSSSQGGSAAAGDASRRQAESGPSTTSSKRARTLVAASTARPTAAEGGRGKSTGSRGGLSGTQGAEYGVGRQKQTLLPQARKREEDVYERLCRVTNGGLKGSGDLILEENATTAATAAAARACTLCMENEQIILMSSCRHLACKNCWEASIKHR